jgi:hypothetical protein
MAIVDGAGTRSLNVVVRDDGVPVGVAVGLVVEGPLVVAAGVAGEDG